MSEITPNPKKLFLILDSGASIRNIMRTDIFRLLKNRSDISVTVFTPIHDQAFRDEFAAHNVHIEPTIKTRPTFLQRFFRTFKKDLWAYTSGVDGYMVRRKRRSGFDFRIRLLKSVAQLLYAGDLKALMRWLMDTDIRFFKLKDHPHFHTYKPDMIFCVTMYAKDPCLEIIAKNKGIKILNMIHSWDNPTTKGPFPFHPDKVIVWNEILRDELINYHGVSAEDIQISGVPQADLYLNRDQFTPKSKFFSQLGLDPNRKLITYTTGTTGMVPQDKDIIEVLQRTIEENRYPFPCQLLVRMHPKDDITLYKHFENRPNFFLQIPGRQSQTNDNWNPTERDMYGLAELMCYSDVVINVASTITIDAAAFDTPIVNIGFDGDIERPFSESCRRFYDFNHYRHVVATQGAPVAYSEQEMTTLIAEYLKNPKKDTEKRELIRKTQYWKLDGNSGKRVAEMILGELGLTL